MKHPVEFEFQPYQTVQIKALDVIGTVIAVCEKHGVDRTYEVI